MDRFPDSEARRQAYAIFRELFDLTPTGAGATLGEDASERPYLRFDPEAQQVFNTWRERFEVSLREGLHHEALESHFTKYRSLFPSLALIFHLANRNRGSIPADCAHMAERACEYLEKHAYRTYAGISRADTASARSLAAKIRSGNVRSGFTLRDVYSKGWAGLSSRDQVLAAVEILEEHGWVDPIVSRGSLGAPKTTYAVNPRVFGEHAPTDTHASQVTTPQIEAKVEAEWEEI